MKYLHIVLLGLLFALSSCVSKPKDVKLYDVLPPIYPDYTDITIPQNMAPLNFLLREDVDAAEVVI